MNGPRSPKDAIQRRVEVEDSERSAVYRTGQTGPARPRNIFLVGPRGSGKTTVGRLAAEPLGLAFVDTDALIAERAGSSIAAYVEAKGWDAFRDLEHAVLADVCTHENQVVATGGGIILREDNRVLLKNSGWTFYLMADVSTLLGRLEADPNAAQRPALTDSPLREEISRVLAEREPLYFSVADAVLQAALPAEDLACEVGDRLRSLLF